MAAVIQCGISPHEGKEKAVPNRFFRFYAKNGFQNLDSVWL
jgi:hypothetical protein